MNDNEIFGIWFYGLAGAGKTFASNTVAKIKQSPFIVDGDNVRSKISTDLGYSLDDRLIQIHRLFGIGVLAIENQCFPIISSVYMTEIMHKLCKKSGIKVVRINRQQAQLNKCRTIYKDEINVVGKGIVQPSLETVAIFNDGTKHFSALVKYCAK